MVRALLFSLFSMLSVTAFAQDNLTGRVQEDKTKIAIPGINVQNLKTHVITVTDRTGAFSIAAHVGDLIVFSGLSYQSDTLYVQNLEYKSIILTFKQNMLKEVRVTMPDVNTGSMKGPQTLSPFNSQTVVYSRDDTGHYIGGLTFMLHDSHSAENKRKRDAQIGRDEELKEKIAGIFSAENLKNYIPITGQELINFITLYTPDIKTYTAPGFNLLLYIDSCYKTFNTIPLEKRQSAQYTQIKPTN